MATSTQLTTQASIEAIKKSELPVIIFGADTVGEVLFYACEEAGIKVALFCDNNKNKISNTHCGLKVVHAPEVKTTYTNAIFLIASTYIKDIIAQLESMGFEYWYDCSTLLRNFDIYKKEKEYSKPMHFVDFAVGACLLSHNGYMDPDKLYLRGVDLIITERCSMKCKDCANLMQYYQTPSNMKIDEIYKTIDKFISVIDEIYEVRVIGGEPLMNPDYHLVVKKLIGEEKVKRVVVYSNATISPKDEHISSLQSDKVIFIITDYGTLSKNLKTMTEKLSKNNINFYVQKASGWTDSGQIHKHQRSEAELEKMFTSCCVKNYTSISDGKLYRCPFSANAARLKATPDHPEDYFDMFKESLENNNLNEIKNKIRLFLSEKKFLNACNFCNGRTYGSPEIQPAIQATRALEYARFS